MDRKGTKVATAHANRQRKRKFQGNRYTIEAETEFVSTSSQQLLSSETPFVTHATHGYRIINFILVFAALSQIVICRECKTDVQFGESGNRGLGFKLAITCTCGVKTIDSCPKINNAFEINRRIVLIMRLLGISREGVNFFCGFMDLCQGISRSTYDAAVQNLHTATSNVFDLLTKQAVAEEKEANCAHDRPPQDLIVSGDGSWKKRGFSSLFGVTTLIGKYTGKVIDLVVKSGFCLACTKAKKRMNKEEFAIWSEDHVEECTANHHGSAGGMEVEAVKDMFGRSIERYGVRYTTYIGDGDCKTYKAILDMQPYGKDIVVRKSEDIGHVHKRMGSRLRNLKKKKEKFKRGTLTVSLINKLSNYYGLAIRKHSDSVENMKNAINATLKHLCSSDEDPQHDLCPAGVDSWCRYRRAQAEGLLDTFTHDPPLSAEIVKFLKPIYADLSKDELLERCVGGESQNRNESFNATIWRLAPKHLHCGLKTLEIAARLAAGIFNKGCSSLLRIMYILGIVIGPQCRQYADYRDKQREDYAQRHSSTGCKEARTVAKEERDIHNEFYELEEGLLYGPGIAD